MCRFFIIDQSLTGVGGHHFEYTRLLARAAGAQGIRPVMATHRHLESGAKTALEAFGEVRPVFPLTVYTPLSNLAGLAELKRRGARQVAGAANARGWWRGLGQRIRSRRLGRARRRHIGQFAAACEQLFAEDTFEEGDQVFFATMSELDLSGLAGFLANHPRSLLATWHVQFHFSIFSGRPGEFDAQRIRESAIHECFHSALSRVPYHDIRFHTTSRELQTQYQRFEMVRFSDLPYPVEPAMIGNRSTRVPVDRPLRLTVAGAVRREKSQKEYLADLLRQLWPTHLATGKIETHIQAANGNLFSHSRICSGPDAPPADRAEYARCVRLHPHPLPDPEYRDLIGNSDIGLFFYDSRRYFSRRAGILSEFLAAGKPVIVPAGCWLSRQIEEPVFQHAANVLVDADQVETLQLRETEWDAVNAPQSGNVIGFDRLKNPWRCRCRPGDPESADGLLIRFRMHWPRESVDDVHLGVRFVDPQGETVGESRRIIPPREDGQPSLALFRCPPGTDSVEMVFRNAWRDTSLSIADPEFSFLGFSGRPFALGRVGTIVADPADLAAAVAEIVDHYPHYLQSAVEFSGAWAHRHDPDLALDALLDRASRFRQVA